MPLCSALSSPKVLAVSLFENDTLTHLDLSYNSVTPSAALVFAFALKVRRRSQTGRGAYVSAIHGGNAWMGADMDNATRALDFLPSRSLCFLVCLLVILSIVFGDEREKSNHLFVAVFVCLCLSGEHSDRVLAAGRESRRAKRWRGGWACCLVCSFYYRRASISPPTTKTITSFLLLSFR